MRKSVAILSLILLFVTIAFVNLTYASQYSLSNEDTHTSPQAGVALRLCQRNPLVGTVAEDYEQRRFILISFFKPRQRCFG